MNSVNYCTVCCIVTFCWLRCLKFELSACQCNANCHSDLREQFANRKWNHHVRKLCATSAYTLSSRKKPYIIHDLIYSNTSTFACLHLRYWRTLLHVPSCTLGSNKQFDDYYYSNISEVKVTMSLFSTSDVQLATSSEFHRI